MKKITFLFLLLIISFSTFSATLNKIVLGRSSMSINISGRRQPKYTTNYDSVNRYLFIEFDNAKAARSFKNKYVNGNYIKDIRVKKYNGSVGVFVFFKKNVKFKTRYTKKPNRFVLDFSKDSSKKDYLIVIDAGHGGKDGGAHGNHAKEKDIALKVAKYLRNELKGDFNILMTRDRDKFISLAERPRMGNRKKADLFVSIHLNAAPKSTSNGFEVFYFSKNASQYAKRVAAYENSFGEKYGEKVDDITQIMGELLYKTNQEKSIKLAESMVSSYPKRLGIRKRGAFGANFAVLRGFDGPGILVELGFISNKKDSAKLKSTKYQKIMADELAKHIKNHFY